MPASLRIRTIVAVGVFALGALVALALALGVFGLKRASDSFDYVDQNSVPSLSHLGEMSAAIEQSRVRTARRLIEQDLADMDVARTDLADGIADVDKRLHDYDQLISDDRERAQLQQIKANWEGIRAVIVPLTTSNRVWSAAEAMTLFNDQIKAPGKVLHDELAKALDYNEQLAHDRNRDTAESLAVLERTALVLGLVAAVLVGGVFVVFRRRLTLPLSTLCATMDRMATGEIDIAVPGIDRQDELGEIARALAGIKTSITERTRREAEAGMAAQKAVTGALGQALGALKSGDLTHRVNQPFPPEYEGLRADFNEAIGARASQVGEVASASGTVGTGAVQIASASEDLARRTERQAAALEETATTVNQLKASVAGTRSATVTATGTAQETRKEAIDSGVLMQDAVNAMEGIAQSSEKMRSIIQIIDGISFQTNLLALNAGVEAARAGEAGRGFAVVANEVRSLAERAAGAAREISELIADSGREVEQGVSVVGRTRDSLDRIVARAGDLATMIEGIAVTSEEQASAIEQAASAVSEIDRTTQQNAALAEETTAASQSLAREAERLSQVVREFTLDAAAGTRASRTPRPAPAPAPGRRAPVAVPAPTQGNAALAMDDWSEF
ncbi:methyl-accepting chemotaxis protein [Novosphingobium bradum]|uniref:Methyl-accepting chemotaxis protein n=1 Tax=Novosphingobium bradum TaxID=1737444 RepID=A0ABV7IQC8_9SPHN